MRSTKCSSLLAVVAGLLVMAAASPSLAEPVAITAGGPMARLATLKEGTRLYLRSLEKDGVARPMDMWRRTVKFETVDGQKRLHVTQLWTAAAPSKNQLELDSWFDADSFAPLTHERHWLRDGQTTHEGFQFAPDAVTGLARMSDNARKDFKAPLEEPAFNFETDLEMMEVLDLKKGWSGRMVFYHPGGGPAKPYIVSVAGEVSAPAPGGRAAACWLVLLDAQAEDAFPASRFFVDKITRQVLRVEQPQADGSLIVKTRLN